MDPTSKKKKKKTSYKDVHLPLGVVGGDGSGESAKRCTFLPNSEEGAECVRQGAGSLCEEQPPRALEWARSRDAVEAGRRTYSSRGAG